MSEVYFFDTYALIEIIFGNPNYNKYVNSVPILTKLNLFELFYKIMQTSGIDVAKKYLEEYSEHAIEYDTKIIEKAAVLKSKNKDMSMADCIGYCVAARFGIKFLTGDDAFKDIDGVEFVK